MINAPARRAGRLALAVSAVLLGSCAGRPGSPTGAPQIPPQVPLVFVPGATGSRLVDRVSGRVVWGDGPSLLRPRDDGYGVARSIDPFATPRLASNGLVLSLRILGLLRKPVYESLLDHLVAEGYRLGDLGAPSRHATLYPFDYDWRQDNVASAAALLGRLHGLHRVRGDQQLTVDLVCQSNGAVICRYLSRFGDASLEAAERGAGRPSWLRVRKLVLAGSSNGGSLAILRLLDRGRRYLPLLGRSMRAEVLATFPSLYQDLPSYRQDLFLDEKGADLPLDLYDPKLWGSAGWSWFAVGVRRRLERRSREDLFGDQVERERFVGRALERARRLHLLLRRPGGGGSIPAIFLVQNTSLDTAARAVVRRRKAGLELVFPSDPWLLRRPALRRRALSPGDGHATVESQAWLSETEVAAVVGGVIEVPGKHWQVLIHPAGRAALTEVLKVAVPGSLQRHAVASPAPHPLLRLLREVGDRGRGPSPAGDGRWAPRGDDLSKGRG